MLRVSVKEIVVLNLFDKQFSELSGDPSLQQQQVCWDFNKSKRKYVRVILLISIS